MSRVNTNVASLIGVRVLNKNTAALNQSLERLSTGLKINRGADDPAGLIASENLRKQIRGTETALKNADRAISIVSTAEGALQEISSMLLEIEGLLAEAANTGGMSQEEIDANQLQVDSILNTIDRISNTTEFAGIKLLNGNLDYTTSSVSTVLDSVKINAAKLIDGATMTVAIKRLSAADTGLVYLSGAGLSGNTPMTIKIGSNRGSTELSFAASTTISAMLFAINEVMEITGVSAALSGTTVGKLRSVDFGTSAYVSVETLNGSQVGILNINSDAGGATNDDLKDFGVNAVATINGTQATADGKVLKLRTAMLDIEIDLNATAAMSATATDWTTTLGITSGGADFALGATVDAIGLEAIGIQNVASTSLSNSNLGYLSSIKSGGANALTGTNLYTAQRIVDQAVKDVSSLRGRLGSFQKNTLSSTINSLRVTSENLYAAESAIRDTDFASETAQLIKSQILVNAATSVLAQANFAPQSVLQLLG